RAGRFDEARGGDRLARGGRMAEAVAPARAGIAARVHLGQRHLVGRLLEVDPEILLFLLLELLLLGGCRAVSVQVWLDLGCGDQLGQHPRERVDLVTAQLGAGGETWRALAEHALE